MSTNRESEDAAWRAIVENYGDRADLSEDLDDARDDADPGTETTATGPGLVNRGESAQPGDVEADRLRRYDDDADRYAGSDDPLAVEPERFVPPDPPLPPPPRGLRLAAWSGVVGAPVVFLICLVLGITLGGLFSLLLVGAFVGGFCYLIATLPDHDDFDDGAVV